MSKLDRMNLLGIRSFGTEDTDTQKIKFLTPLTLIQGQNGCGKTTIIEAIKFGITGEVPGGSSRGQGFVYDPKLSKTFTSTGKIKLRIIDGRGELVTVFKAVRVTQKGPDKLEFKRLDSTISRRKQDEAAHASNRCADVDQEMCIALGVSKAIINQVLFCHQEDSNWPLEEPKKLKERFDEIFDAAKYNKCTDHIEKKIKDKTQESKVLKIGVQTVLETKDYVQRKKQEMHEKKDKYDEFSNQIEEIDEKLTPLNQRINELYESEQNFAQLYTNIELKKKELELLQQQQKTLLKDINEFEGSDADLKSKLTHFENELKNFEREIDELKEKKQECHDSEKDLSDKINKAQNQLGLLRAESNHNLKITKKRDELIHAMSQNLKLSINPTKENIEECIEELIDGLEKNKMNVKMEKERMQKEEEKMQIQIDRTREESAQLEQKIKSERKLLAELRSELRNIRNKLEELNTSDEQLKFSEDKIQRLERDMKSLEASVDIEALKQQIEKDKGKLRTLNERNETVENEIRTLQQYTTIQTELDVKRENLLSKQSEHQKLMNKHKEALEYIFDNNVPERNLKNSVVSHIHDKRREFKTMEKEMHQNQQKVAKFENNLRASKEKLKERQSEYEENVLKLAEVCDDNTLDNELDKTSNKLKNLHDQRGSLASSTYLYKNFIKNFKEDKPCCPLCKRNVEEKKMVDTIINDIQKQIENIPNELNNLDKMLKVEQKWYEKLLALQPLDEKNKKLLEEIPGLEAQVDIYAEEHSNALKDLNDLKENMRKVESNLDTSNSVVGDVSLIDQCQKEMVQLKEQISSLEESLPSSSKLYDTEKRSIDEAMTERENLNREIRSTQGNIEALQTETIQHRERLQAKREQKNKLLAQQLTIKKNLQDKDHLVIKSVETEQKADALEETISKLDEKIQPTRQQLNANIKAKNDLRVEHQHQIEQLNSKFNENQKIMEQIKSIQGEIGKFESKNVMQQIEKTLEDVAGSKKDIEVYSNKRKEIDVKIDDLKQKVSNGQMYQRELQDNIQLRKIRSKAQNLQKDIETEEHNLGENDISEIRSKKTRLINKCDQLTNNKHRLEGEKNQLKQAINDIKKELQLPKYENAAEDFRRKHLAFLLHEHVIEDLRKFNQAMRWAMMQYHKERMVQVNRTVKDLWRSIYKGNDIDYIEIKTDDIGTKGQDKRKVYNYKVVQVKNEVELEMRGRCSAGQRVLASLIIRIALAETFSNNCGILALDEPTTNLDRENINSLADSLIELIQQKREQEHFQLLIITHDQEFVDRLSQMESLDMYYEVTRNAVGKSVITVHNKY